MLDLNDLINNLKNLRSDFTSGNIANDIAKSMKEETDQNFENEEYGNDGTHEKWDDRPYESELHYKKLDYTGMLKNSIQAKGSNSNHVSKATLTTNVEYAKVHNEGGKSYTGQGRRYPPKSSKPLNIKRTNITQRQFMGIGIRTIQNAERIISDYFKKRL